MKDKLFTFTISNNFIKHEKTLGMRLNYETRRSILSCYFKSTIVHNRTLSIRQN